MPSTENREEKEKVWFREARHVEDIHGAALETLKHKDDWRKIRERMKTVSVALVLCLNVGTDPPDVQKPHPCARKEAWVDPNTTNPQRSSQKIGQSLQKIYEKLQPRARYKSAIDPTVECVRKLCSSMRRNAKDERVLFHFNGHGVPKPTEAGEIWVFNKNITQYIPLSLYDLQAWMGFPSVYLWDCNSAGTIVNMFLRFADDHSVRWMEEYREMRDRDQQQHQSPGPLPPTAGDAPNTSSAPLDSAPINDAASSTSTNSHSTIPSHKNCIQLGACAAGEHLPLHNADLPADLFTCCLTTPIQTSLLCHMLKTGTKNHFPPNIIDEIPGVLSDRRTLLGELNWIFTAITDTIAWSCLPMHTFQKLFRQDLLIASLFRSFLLAERIMRENGCHVTSTPQLPEVHAHPLWEYWDYTLDLCVTNLYNLLQPKQRVLQFARNDCFVGSTLRHNLLIDLSLTALTDSEYAYSWFFIEQLQAFEVWLKFGVDKQEPPQQLPIVLQVLLSQIHRVRALELLARFVDLGPWAVVSALSVGIFPYVLKLLQCGTRELRPALAFIWAKILAIDPGCQHELVKDNGYFYFLQVLDDPTVSPRMKIIPAFVMATIIYNNYRPAQEKLVQSDYVTLCIELLSNERVMRCRMLCLWLLIGLGRLWAECDKARWQAIRNVAYDKAIEFLNDEVPEVRAAAVFALGCFVHNTSRNNEHATMVENEVCDKLFEKCIYDGSVLVRTELAAAIQWFVIDFQEKFATICAELDRRIATQSPTSLMQIGNGTLQEGQEMSKAMAAMCLSPTESELFLAENASSETAPSIATHSPQRRKLSSQNGHGGQKQHPGVSKSSSVYAILPRAASTMFPNSSQLRRRFSPVRKVSAMFSSSAGGSASTSVTPSVNATNLDSKNLFKLRVLLHIRALEAKQFKEGFERIWLFVLRMGLDPFEDVARMGEKIISYIFELSSKIKEARDKTLELKTGRTNLVNGPIVDGTTAGSSINQQLSPDAAQYSNPEKVTFLVGTPQGVASSSGIAFLASEGTTTTTGAAANSIGDLSLASTPITGIRPSSRKTTSSSARTSSGGEASNIDVVEGNLPTTSNSIVEEQVDSSGQPQVPNPSNQQHPQSKRHPEMDKAKRRLLMDPFIHQSLYTPKRSVFGTHSAAYSQVPDSTEQLLAELSTTVQMEGLVRSSFVDWCSKTWTETIYDTIYDEKLKGFSTRNSLVDSDSPFTLSQPTDWAIHTHEGIRQRAKKEVEVLKAKNFRCETQIMQLKLDRQATSIVWSFLRPYVYIGDGQRVRIYSYPTGGEYQAQSGSESSQVPPPPPPSELCLEFCAGSESFLRDSITDLMVTNELTHELLMTGTRNGLLRVWDPMFHEHSHELRGTPKMITATYLLNDVPRIGSGNDKTNHTLYRWDQGRLVVAGNVRICRVWDACAENSVFDVTLKHTKGSVVALGSELRYNMVSCGFSDGTVALFDTRAPSKGCQVYLRDSSAPVVGMAMLVNEQMERLLVGTRDGEIRLWEPRMYKEALIEFNVNKALRESESGRSIGFGALSSSSSSPDLNRQMQRMEVQTKGELVACAMDDATVSVFDIDGKGGVLSRMRYPTAGGRLSSASFSSAAMSGLNSLLRRRHNSISESVESSDASGSTADQLSPQRHAQSNQQQHHSATASPAAMRFHQSRVLLGLATAGGQFHAFAMPSNMESAVAAIGRGGRSGGGSGASRRKP